MTLKLPAKSKVTYTILMSAYGPSGLRAVPLLDVYQKTRDRCGSMGYGRWLERYVNPLALEGYGYIQGSEFMLHDAASTLVLEEVQACQEVEKPDLVKANLFPKFRKENFGPGDRMFSPPARAGALDYQAIPSLLFNTQSQAGKS